jgi:ABC-type arginine transport system permease subunit
VCLSLTSEAPALSTEPSVTDCLWYLFTAPTLTQMITSQSDFVRLYILKHYQNSGLVFAFFFFFKWLSYWICVLSIGYTSIIVSLNLLYAVLFVYFPFKNVLHSSNKTNKIGMDKSCPIQNFLAAVMLLIKLGTASYLAWIDITSTIFNTF